MKYGNGGPAGPHAEKCACGKKRSTKAQATKEAKYLKYHKKYPGEVPQAYKCKISGWWHVGNLRSI